MLKLELSPGDVQRILDALSVQPYNQVYDLIASIIGQTNRTED